MRGSDVKDRATAILTSVGKPEGWLVGNTKVCDGEMSLFVGHLAVRH